MGLRDWFAGRTKEEGVAVGGPADAGAPAFAVLDVETTGLSPRNDRIIELAIVRVDATGAVVDEWTSRFNPEGPVGATHIHGIRDADVQTAPLFREVAGEISARVEGLPVSAHNAPFDLAFLRAEFTRAGWDMPWLASFCTLEGSRYYLPDLDRRRLADCCWAVGVDLEDAHSALGDARATARLLEWYLRGFAGAPTLSDLLSLPAEARSTAWPDGPVRPPVDWIVEQARADRAKSRFPAPKPTQPSLVVQLTQLSLVEVLDEGAPDGAVPYLETLLDALEDGEVTADESAHLSELVGVFGLTRRDIAASHSALMLALAHRAVDDGRVSQDERAQLRTLAGLLNVPESRVTDVIHAADNARTLRLSAALAPLGDDWAFGEPLRVGDKVAFTGCDGSQRAALETRAASLGVRVVGSVSKLTAMLVTDSEPTEPYPSNKLSAALSNGTRLVHPDTFAILLDHLQPARTPTKLVPIAAPLDSTHQPAAPVGAVSSAHVRAWAIQNGYAVGVRGRLPADVLAAYRAAASATG